MSVLQHAFLPLRRLSRVALMLVLATVLVGATLRDAEARSRGRVGVAIGIGILGAIILNEAVRSEDAYQRRSYRSAEPRRSYRSTRKEQRYSEPVQKKQKVRSAAKSRSKSKAVQPAQEVAAAPPSVEQEAELPATEGTAATASPQPDNSYLPDAARKKAARTAAKLDDLPPAASAAPTQAQPQPDAGKAPDTISTPDEIKSAQEHLKYMGYDIPTATGALDAPTRAAFSAFQTSVGARPTGILTYDQLQTLFVKAAGLADGKAATRQR